MGLWLESNDEDLSNEGTDDSSSLAMMMQDGTNIAGLSSRISKEKFVTASLQWHYSKTVGVERCDDDDRVRFVIQADGVVDEE